ncbi:ABC transporter permease [Planomonospora venezuelensis]|uniref:NitT/TauT family transport system permease protein n=1 Tax=Planomonospora venezuelensis TaxID=1999 RepID=A0A841DF76_PLAVE|nr:ABC transporter permease [Planomonospora venezuelensis]MBB5967054.1 NitT/TauT family transport system permease protein [Planomonospora venezuelensis]GIN04894.1 ABC transporter permease [Planomonospora venezuelensis]
MADTLTPARGAGPSGGTAGDGGENADGTRPAGRAVPGTGSARGDAPTADDRATNFFRTVAGTRTSVASRLVTGVNRSLALVLLAGVWEVLPRTGAVDPVFVPPLSEVLLAWYDLLLDGRLAEHFQASLTRSFSGFGLAIVLAIPLGLAIGWYRPVADFLSPVLELFRNTSAVALLPVFILIFGLGETSKIVFVFYACAWPILLNTVSGVRTVEPLLVKSARSMGLGPVRLFQKVILPAAVPTVFTGIRLAGAYSILVLIFAEMVGAKAGLGYLIQDSQFSFRIPDMYAGIITISALGLLFNLLLLGVERRFSTWRTT